MTKKNLISNLIATAVFTILATINVFANQVTPSTDSIQLVENGIYTIDYLVQFDQEEQMNRLEIRDTETSGCILYNIIEAPEQGYYTQEENITLTFGNISDGTKEYFITAYDDEGNEFFYYEGSFEVIPIPVPTVSENTVSENTVSANSINIIDTIDEEDDIPKTKYRDIPSTVVANNTNVVVDEIEEIKPETKEFFAEEDLKEDDIEDIDLDEDDCSEVVVNAPVIRTKNRKNGMQFKIRSDKGTKLEIKYSKNNKKWKKLCKKNINFKCKATKATVTVKARAYVVLEDGSKVYSDWTYATEKCK